MVAMLSPEFLKTQQEKLVKQKQELENEIVNLSKSESQDLAEGATADVLDRAARDSEVLVDEAKLTQLKQELADVEHSLAKFETEKYGICEKCSAEIDTARLQMLPTACLCMGCKIICDNCGTEIEEARVLGKKLPAACQNCEEEFEPQVSYTSSTIIPE